MSKIIYYELPDSKFYSRQYIDQYDTGNYAYDYYVSNAIKIYVENLGVIKIYGKNTYGSFTEQMIDIEPENWFKIKLSAQSVSNYPVLYK